MTLYGLWKGTTVVEPTTDRAKKVLALAARLRVLHAELSGEDPGLRGEQLRDEVNRAVAAVQPHEREKFLQELLVEFPTWASEGGGSQARTVVKEVEERVIVEEVRDPAELVRRLLEATKGMSEGDRAKITEKLAAGGLVKREVTTVAGPAVVSSGGSGGGLPDATVGSLRRVVGAAADSSFGADRMGDMLVIATDYLIRVEMMSTTFARDIGVDGKYSAFVQQTMKKDAERFLTGDAKVTKEMLQKSEANNRVLIAAVVRAVRRAGEQFAADHMTRFAPEEIDKAVGAAAFGRAGKCWDAYCAMMKAMDKASIARRIQDLVKKEVEAWLDQFTGQ